MLISIEGGQENHLNGIVHQILITFQECLTSIFELLIQITSFTPLCIECLCFVNWQLQERGLKAIYSDSGMQHVYDENDVRYG